MEVQYCATYEASTKDSTELKCLSCANQYYWDLSALRCLMGSTAFCRVYETTANVCIECVNGYYLKADD